LLLFEKRDVPVFNSAGYIRGRRNRGRCPVLFFGSAKGEGQSTAGLLKRGQGERFLEKVDGTK
jgi:hypothetical protein